MRSPQQRVRSMQQISVPVSVSVERTLVIGASVFYASNSVRCLVEELEDLIYLKCASVGGDLLGWPFGKPISIRFHAQPFWIHLSIAEKWLHFGFDALIRLPLHLFKRFNCSISVLFGYQSWHCFSAFPLFRLPFTFSQRVLMSILSWHDLLCRHCWAGLRPGQQLFIQNNERKQ